MSPSTPPDDEWEEAKVRILYRDVIERICDLVDITPAPGWEERAQQRWVVSCRAVRRRRLLVIALTLFLVALVIVMATALRSCSLASADEERALDEGTEAPFARRPRSGPMGCSIEIRTVVSLGRNP